MLKALLLGIVVMTSSCKGVSQEKQAALKDNTIQQENFKIVKTKEEWRKQLSDLQYFVLREEGTERAFSSDLLKINEEGVYTCAGCGTEVFKSEYKFDSGTGWPSFDREIKGNVAFDVDYKIGYERTEEHCAVCGGHKLVKVKKIYFINLYLFIGNKINDGPYDTTGKRHCINGAALNFVPNK